LLLSAPPQQTVDLGPQQQVVSCNPKIGVHTRLTDEVEEWKIKLSLALAREMGATWVVEYFPWAYIEPEPGRFDWRHSDVILAHASRQGLSLVARLGYTPAWARPDGSTPSMLPQANWPAFAAFCAAFAARYRGVLSRVVIWNEPNLALEWGFRPPSPEQYSGLLSTCYPAIKASAPETIVLAGALAPMPSPLDDPTAMDDLTYLERLYAAGGGQYFDELAVHSYGWAYPADEPPDPGKVSFRRAELLRGIMETHGDGAKACLITEAGWNDHPRWTRAVSPSQRVLFTQQAYDLAYRSWPWCRAVAMWVLRFPWPQRSYQDYFAFLTSDFEPRPVYLAVKAYASNCVVAERPSQSL
jgi:hypothetical protein